MNLTYGVFGHLNEARRLIDAGDLSRARSVNASILTFAPRSTAAWLQASRLEGLAGHYRLARDHALRAFHTLEGAPPKGIAASILRRLQALNQGSELIEIIDSLTENSLNAQLIDAIATTLNQLNQPLRALEFVEKGLRNDPNSLDLKLTRAHTFMFLGRLEEADVEMTQCMRQAPENGFGWWTLSRLKKQTPDSNHIDAIRRQIPLSANRPDNLAFLAYGLHKELDDLGDYPEAAKALDLACKTRRGHLRHSPEETRRIFSQLSRIENGAPPAVESDRTPIFIVGMHRSGTTLLEHILDGHSRVQGLGELYEFTAQMRYATDHWCKGVIDSTLISRLDGIDWGWVGREYLNSIEWRCGADSHFTDKLPSNFLNIGFILRSLPQARILHMVRDPMETCFSNLREYFAENTNSYSYDFTELAQFFIQYKDLMAHWHRAFPGKILDVHYSRLTGDTQGMMEEVTRFCGLDFEPGMLGLQHSKRAVTTASAVQVRQGIVTLEKPRWLPYAGYLKPMADALDDGAHD